MTEPITSKLHNILRGTGFSWNARTKNSARNPRADLVRLAKEQGITGPTDLDKLLGSMDGAIDDEFMAALAECRSGSVDDIS